MPNPVMWFEVIGPDSTALQKFYREVFAWKLTPPNKDMGNYSMIQGHEPGIGGGIGEGPTRVSVYLESPDPQRLLDKALAAGATLVMPVTTITPDTTIAMFTDPAGNTIGLMKANPRTAARPRAGAARSRSKSTVKRTTGATRKRTAAKERTKRR